MESLSSRHRAPLPGRLQSACRRSRHCGSTRRFEFRRADYLRALLAEQEKISITPRYVKTHTNVYRHVIMGEVVAGGGANTTLAQEPAEVQAQLRVLFETPAVVAHPLAAHPRMPEGVRQTVTTVLLEMGNDPAWKTLLAGMQIARPVKADYAMDYQPLENMKLEKYAVIEKN